jgi:hypothetical protein
MLVTGNYNQQDFERFILSHVSLDENFTRDILRFDISRIKRQVIAFLPSLQFNLNYRFWSNSCVGNYYSTPRISGSKLLKILLSLINLICRQPFYFKSSEEAPQATVKAAKEKQPAEDGNELLSQHLGIRPLRYL